MAKRKTRSGKIKIRPFRRADCAAAQRFCGTIFRRTARGFDFERWFARPKKGDRRSFAFVAERRGRLVGLVLASIIPLDWLNRPSRPHGRFELIAVVPSLRRRGVATALWRRMEARLKRLGVRRVTTMSRPLSYGVEILKYPAAAVLLMRLGFEKKQEIYDQEADLRKLNCDTSRKEKQLRRDGITIRRAEFADKKPLHKFLKGMFPQWLDVPNGIDEKKGGHHIHLALKGRRLIAFSASYGGGFGPIGVNPRYRWKGLGKVLLLRCLKDIRGRGHKKAFIGWANYPFYAKAISSPITRMLWQMEKELPR